MTLLLHYYSDCINLLLWYHYCDCNALLLGCNYCGLTTESLLMGPHYLATGSFITVGLLPLTYYSGLATWDILVWPTNVFLLMHASYCILPTMALTLGL